MPKPMIRIHDAETGEVIDREMTDDEFATHQSDLEFIQQKIAAKESKEATKNALLERLGLTADEAALLVK